MTPLPYQSNLGYKITESHTENKVSFKTGSYEIEAGLGINPVDTDYNVTWYLPTSSKVSLLNDYRSNPFTQYEFSPNGGSEIKVVITQVNVEPIRVDNSYWMVNATLKRRY